MTTPAPVKVDIGALLNELRERTRVIEPCELTDKQRTQWDETCAMMSWVVPGFNHLFYRLLNVNNNKYFALFTKAVPTAMVDGSNIMINPDAFFAFPLLQRLFILVHEVCHPMLDDCNFMHFCHKRGTVPMMDGTTLPFDHGIMNEAMDLRINAMLVKQGIGQMPMKDGKVFGCLDTKMDGTENLLEVYQRVYKGKPKSPPGKGGQDGDPSKGNGQGQDTWDVAPPGSSTGQAPDQAAQSRNKDQWQVEIAQAMAVQRKQGQLAAGLQRMFDRLLEPEVRWQDHILTLINRITGSGGWNWQEPDQWWQIHDFFAPRRTGRGAGWIVIWGDTSGSRSDLEIASNVGEIAGIIEDVNPARITLIWCDADITKDSVIELDEASDLKGLKPMGGGGTSVKPVFDWIAKQQGAEPDLFIGFTDGEVGFPTPPRIPIIWASSTEATYPYGQVVRVCRRPEHA